MTIYKTCHLTYVSGFIPVANIGAYLPVRNLSGLSDIIIFEYINRDVMICMDYKKVLYLRRKGYFKKTHYITSKHAIVSTLTFR